jgi:carboxyl-terminal processing protease
VRLTLRRGARERATSIVRGQVRWPVAQGRVLDGGIGYLQPYGDSEGAAPVIRRELGLLLEARPRALIVALRENDGGYTREFLDTDATG